MKFRTDFVTNSSSSSFITFHIQSRKLMEAFNRYGIHIMNDLGGEYVENDEIHDDSVIVLPSGRQERPSIRYDSEMIPEFSGNITEYMIDYLGMLGEDGGQFEQFSEVDDEDEWLNSFDSDLVEFHKEFKPIIDRMRAEKAIPQDDSIQKAYFESGTAFESTLGRVDRVTIKDGKRLSCMMPAIDLEDIEEEDRENLWNTYTGGSREAFFALTKELGLLQGDIDADYTTGFERLSCAEAYVQKIGEWKAPRTVSGTVFTHTKCKNEAELDALIERHGGTTKKSVSSKTNVLILGDTMKAKTSKVDKVLELNADKGMSIRAITEGEFRKLIQSDGT